MLFAFSPSIIQRKDSMSCQLKYWNVVQGSIIEYNVIFCKWNAILMQKYNATNNKIKTKNLMSYFLFGNTKLYYLFQLLHFTLIM